MKAPQKSLKKWTKQKWRTSDGSKSEGKKRYLPDKAWGALSASEKAEQRVVWQVKLNVQNVTVKGVLTVEALVITKQ